ncbi:unnamed protein product [uncultured bacterium]|nr:unnamed protein product [uncultured bacterium]
MKKAASIVESFGSIASKGLAVLAAYFSTQAFAGMVKGAMDASDAIHGMAREMGISNEKLGEYHHVAKAAGIDTATMEGAVEKLSTNLADIATQGVGPAADALRHYGLSARQLASAGPDAALKASVDLLARIPNAAERAAVATELFGKSGRAMIRISLDGAGAIDRLGQEAKELGLAISDVDSEKIKEANDAMGTISDTLGGVVNRITIGLVPYIKYAADLLVDFTKEGMRGGTLVSQGFDFIKEAIVLVVDALDTLKNAAYIVRGAFSQLTSTAVGGFGEMAKFWNNLPGMSLKVPKGAVQYLDAWKDTLDEMGKAEVGEGFDKIMEGAAAKAARTFIDDIEINAQKRAVLAAGKEAESRKGGPFERTKLVATKFASGAATQGSAAAYSAIVQARGAQQTSMQTRIAQDTKTTAEATTRVAAGVGRLVDIATRMTPGDPAVQPGLAH